MSGWSRLSQGRERATETPAQATKQLWDIAWDSLVPAGPDGSPITNQELLRLFKESVDESYFDDDGLKQLPRVDKIPLEKGFFERMNETFWRYGPLVVAPLGPLRTVSVSDPGIVKCLRRTSTDSSSRVTSRTKQNIWEASSL